MTNNFDLNKFNSFLNSAAETIACGPECQKQKKADQLKDNYLNAESNLTLAEPQFQIAKQNYYTYVSGQSGYNDMIEQEYTQKADMIAQKFKENYDEEIAKIKSELNTYNGLAINFRNVVDLYTNYKKENVLLFKKLKDESNDVLTNERKTYYEDQQNDVLNLYYYYFLIVLYCIVVICFLIFSIIYPSSIDWKIRVFLGLLFVILPFISTFIFGKIIQIVYWLYSLLPKNVYK
jgi:hypothetical protein